MSVETSFELRVPNITLESDVILTCATRQMFEEAIGAMRHHKTIYSDWGFEKVDPMGRNMVLNFYGPPGTGKTLAAEAFAGTLSRKYIYLGISGLESKYVGETAKNIVKAFMVASEENAILFFDEADTLLGARLSSVTQGIDNEINAMRSTMLIELEKFNGIVIFATNFPKNFDSAFVSRIRYNIEFMLPDYDGRKQLWNRFLMTSVPLEEERNYIIDQATKESEGLSGREIRNVLRTAYPRAIVSNPDEPKVRWEHIYSAIIDIQTAKRNVGKQHQNSKIIDKSQENVEVARGLLGVG